MSTPELKLLVVEDSVDDAELLVLEVEAGGYACRSRVVEDAVGLSRALAEGPWDAVVSDHSLPGFDSIAALEAVRASDPDVPFIIVSGCIGEEAAVEAMKAGADDYLMKGNLARLLPAIERGRREAAVRRERREAVRRLEENEARLRVFTDNVPCLMLQLEVRAGGVLSVRHISGRSGGLLGLGSDDIVYEPERLFGCFGARGAQLRALLTDPTGQRDEVHWNGQVEDGPGVGAWFDFRAQRRRGCEDVVWDGIFFDATRQKLVELEVREVNRRLRELSSRANATREAERARIARELHDDLGGSLTALKIDLFGIRDEGAEPDKLEQMIRLVDDTVAAVRRICADLHPRILDDLGLLPALEWQIERFRERTGLACTFRRGVEEVEPDRATAIAVFRAFQEALTNVARHAEAAAVDVILELEGDSLYLEIRDDGVGIAPGRLERGDSLGVLGMQERLREVGGQVLLDSAPGNGTRVGVRVPLGRNDASVATLLEAESAL